MKEEEFKQYIKHYSNSNYLVIDTEGTINHPFSQTWGLSIASQGVSEYFPFNHLLGENLPQSWLVIIKELIENHKCIIFHNAGHDLKALNNLNINYTGKFYDTMLMAHMVDENIFSKELEYLTKMIGGEPKRNKELMSTIIKAFGWEYIPVDIITPYGRGDASDTEDLFKYFYPDFQSQGFDGELWDWEQDLTRLLMDIKDRGILIDQDLCNQELEKGEKICKALQEELGFNPGSPKELGKFLIEDLGLPVIRKSKKTGNPSFDKEALKIYDESLSLVKNDRAKLIRRYRGWAKTIGSNYRPYLEYLGPDGRLRTTYKQHGTLTGRLSASWMQQIPRQSSKEWNGNLKKVFIVEPGRTRWEVDFSQLEMRLYASYGKERSLLEIFNDPTRDLFDEMAATLKRDRDTIKTMNYALGYGAQGGKVGEILGVSETVGKIERDRYYKTWPGLLKFSNLAQRRAKENGYVSYWTGRRRHIIHEGDFHKAANSVIQGGAFEIVKRAMVRTRQEGLLNSDECKMDIQVHDSGGFDIEDGKEHIYLPEIKRIWEGVQPYLGVPFRVDIHKWATKEKWSG